MDYYTYPDPGWMQGWNGLVGWPIEDILPTKWSSVNHRLGIGQVTVCWPKTDVLTSDETNYWLLSNPQGDGKIEWACVAWMNTRIVHLPKEVTNTSTNRARRSLNLLTWTTLTTTLNCHQNTHTHTHTVSWTNNTMYLRVGADEYFFDVLIFIAS